MLKANSLDLVMSFKRKLLCEGIRALENNKPTLVIEPKQTDAPFDDLLKKRAQRIDNQLEISKQHHHIDKITKGVFHLLVLIFAVLGASAVLQVFFSDQHAQINFFWSFVLFFIPNLISLLIWLYLFLVPKSLTHTYSAKFSLFLIKQVEHRFNLKSTQAPHYWALFKSYFHLQFSGKVGRYQLSLLTHRLWLSYFVAATLVLVIKLSTYQVDFIWQTSLLSASSFTWLTQILAILPALLGFPVPDSMQIAQSQIGLVSTETMAESTRFAWSSLLVSSLIIYGIIPRLLLLLLMNWQLKQTIQRTTIDVSQHYYVALRQLIKPNISQLGVIDKDDELQCIVSKKNQKTAQKRDAHRLPEDTFPIAIELSTDQYQEAISHNFQLANNGLNIESYQDQQDAVAQLKNSKKGNVSLYIALSQLADRGMLRFITALKQDSHAIFYLVFIELDTQGKPIDGAVKAQRQTDWAQLAKQAGIPLENIAYLKN